METVLVGKVLSAAHDTLTPVPTFISDVLVMWSSNGRHVTAVINNSNDMHIFITVLLLLANIFR